MAKLSLMRLLYFIFFCVGIFSAKAQVVINEICPANADINYDLRYFNFSGWVELYNPGATSVNIGGYYLSDKLHLKSKWRIPSGTSIPAKGFILIWCDEGNNGLHTNFSLDAEGEDLILSNGSLVEVDRVTFDKQYTNISFGRITDGATEWGYLLDPTPGFANKDKVGVDQLENPLMSLKAGRYSGTQLLSISHSDPEAEIRYTTDGSDPKSNSTLFKESINIANTTTVKAKAFKEGFIPSGTEVKTYFIGEPAFTLPVMSVSTKPTYLWDNTIGIYTEGTNGVAGYCQNLPYNWNQDWDRHADIEFFDITGNKQFDQDVDIRIGGNCSRTNPQKSLVIKARDKYGKNTIDERLFEGKEHSSYGGFHLRNSGNDFWNTMFRDALMQTLVVGQMDIDYMAYEPKIVYLNGAYWGIQNLREKIDADYFETNYGVDKDDLDLGEAQHALEGSIGGYQGYLATLQTIDLSTEEAYEYIEGNIDVQEFINYMVAEIYYCNTDWPGNNVKFWRQRSTNGKWRWVLWDTDFGFGLYPEWGSATHPTLNFATESNGPGWPNPPWSTLHLRLLLQNPKFKDQFIRTFSASLSTTFRPSRVIDFIDTFEDRLKKEIPRHTNRWGQSEGNWLNEVDRLRTFAEQRNEFMHGHLASFFQLDSRTIGIDVNTQPANGNAVVFNNITASDGIIAGRFPAGVSYTLMPKAVAGYQFSHWDITITERSHIPVIGKQSDWKYLDTGIEPSTAWTEIVFDDSAWKSGFAKLGYGDANINTTLSYGSDPNNKFITTWFRKTFDLENVNAFDEFRANILFDDGVIVYLNGEEVFRANLPEGTISSNTTALQGATENAYSTFTIPIDKFLDGENVLAVAIHQVSGTSSDISFDFELTTSITGESSSSTSTEPSLSGVADDDLQITAHFEEVTFREGLVINEFSAGNSDLEDEKGEKEDWIEIFNWGTEPIDLAGHFITDDLSKKRKFQMRKTADNETVIAPGAYKILWADEELNDGPLHVNLKLSNDGESIGLYQMVGQQMHVVDEVTFNGYNSESTYSRIPNATGDFVLTFEATPLAENVFVEVPVSIDEENLSDRISIYPNPVSDRALVESHDRIRALQLLSSTGRLVRSWQEGEIPTEVAMSDLPAGIYLFRVKTATKWSTRKVIKTTTQD